MAEAGDHNAPTEEFHKAQPHDTSVVTAPVNRLDNPTTIDPDCSLLWSLNHPSAVLRKWKSARNQNRRLSPIEKCRQENTALKQENFRLRRECDRFGGDLWDPADRPEDIATVMVAKLSKNKAEAVACAILKALKGKTQA